MRLLGILLGFLSFYQAGIGVQEARDAYFRYATEKKGALTFERLLDPVPEDADPVLVCYKGSAEMVKAKNAVNVFHKLSCFNRGRMLIEESIARDTSRVESRFIRYTIQCNLPLFLNYRENIPQDSIMIATAMHRIADADLKNKIRAYFNYRKMALKKG